MPTPLFNPDHSTSVLLENGQNPAIRESYTIAQILNFAASLGNDSVIIKPDFVNYDQTACYYQIYSFNLGTLSEYYVASGDWYDTNPETQSDIFVQSIAGSTGLYEQCKVIALTNNGLANVNNVQYNVISTLKTKDGINYLDFNWNIYGRQEDPYIFATNANIGTLYINGEAPVSYQWTSVPAISGKNGILSLTTLKEESINDGSPVDDATASAFNNAPNSCSVGGIVSVDLPIVDDNPLSIAVKYNIPELTDSVYSSCKVVAKKNKIPKSKTDGDKILDVSPSSHGCVIRGLEQETNYYVVVFVEDSFGNKAESEPGGPVRTGKQDGIFKMRITTMQGVKDNGIKEVITITQQ